MSVRIICLALACWPIETVCGLASDDASVPPGITVVRDLRYREGTSNHVEAGPGHEGRPERRTATGDRLDPRGRLARGGQVQLRLTSAWGPGEHRGLRGARLRRRDDQLSPLGRSVLPSRPRGLQVCRALAAGTCQGVPRRS